MKNLRYILAGIVAAASLSVTAFAVGDAVEDIGDGVGGAINGAGNAIGDIMGREDTTAADPDPDATTADTTAADTSAEETTGATTTESVTFEVVTGTPAPEVTQATTTSPTIVEGENNKNPGTGVAAGVTAAGAIFAGLTAVIAKKRR